MANLCRLMHLLLNINILILFLKMEVYVKGLTKTEIELLMFGKYLIYLDDACN